MPSYFFLLAYILALVIGSAQGRPVSKPQDTEKEWNIDAFQKLTYHDQLEFTSLFTPNEVSLIVRLFPNYYLKTFETQNEDPAMRELLNTQQMFKVLSTDHILAAMKIVNGISSRSVEISARNLYYNALRRPHVMRGLFYLWDENHRSIFIKRLNSEQLEHMKGILLKEEDFANRIDGLTREYFGQREDQFVEITLSESDLQAETSAPESEHVQEAKPSLSRSNSHVSPNGLVRKGKQFFNCLFCIRPSVH